MKTPALDQLIRSSARMPGVISFGGGMPASSTFPKTGLANAATHAILEMQEALQYDWPEGRRPLRDHIAARLRARGADVDADDVLITNGGQDALALVLDLLAPKAVQVDAETYSGALDVMKRHGCEAIAGHRLPMRYAMPALQNPRGLTATAEQRADILESDFVIEDDAYADLLFDQTAPRPLLADARNQVFHVGTFSKVLSPGLRVGWLVPPREFLRAARELKSSRDLQTSGLCQALVEQLLGSPRFNERLASLRTHYRQRAELLLSHLPRLHNVRFTMPSGGFTVWVETNDCYASDEALLSAAVKNGVAFDPGCLFRVNTKRGQPAAMRLAFSSVDEAAIATGIERLQKTLHEASAKRHRQAA